MTTIGQRPVRLDAGEGEARWWFGGLATIKLDGAATGEALSLIEMLYPPDLEVPRHVHLRQSELFYVLDGEMTVRIGDDAHVAAPGAVLFVPRGVPHGFTVTSPGPARYLIMHAPAGFEGFVRATSEPARHLLLPPPGPPPTPEQLAATDALMAGEYATEWVR